MDKAFEIALNNTLGTHISYDIDVIDPVIAPGVSVPEINGINLNEANEIMDYLVSRKPDIKSMDIVEFNPTRDILDKTKEIASNLLNKFIK
jgi:arginase